MNLRTRKLFLLCLVSCLNSKQCLIRTTVLHHQTYRHVAQSKHLCVYPLSKIWYQCILTNYATLSLSDSAERRAVIVGMCFSEVVKLCITCIAGWAKIRIVLGMEPRVPLSSLTPVPITAVTNPLCLTHTQSWEMSGWKWMSKGSRWMMNEAFP